MRASSCLLGLLAIGLVTGAASEAFVNETCLIGEAEYLGINGEETVNVTTFWPNGFEVAYFSSMEQAVCSTSWINIPGIHLLSTGVRAFLYFLALVYSFLGIAIIADIFMAAVEVICAQEKVVKLKDGTTITAQVWNPTVANLTLMALGSSAPEIMLAVLDGIWTLNKMPGELGPSTIVGSAAFNLLMITSVCILTLPGTSVKSISDISVFYVTATWSVLVYVWMFVVLDVWTPGVVSLAEAWITLLAMVLFVGQAYLQDRNWFTASKEKPCEESTEESHDGKVININVVDEDGQKMHTDDKQNIKRIMRTMKKPIAGTKNKLQSFFSVVAETVSHGSVKKAKTSSLFWKVNARHKMAGRKHVATQEEAEQNHNRKTSRMSMESGSRAPNRFGLEDEASSSLRGDEGGSMRSIRSGGRSKRNSRREKSLDAQEPEMLESRVTFTSHDYRVIENAGSVKLAVRRIAHEPAMSLATVVNYMTYDGTAISPADYSETKGKLVFEAGETIKYIDIPIHDNDEPNHDKTFNVCLSEHREYIEEEHNAVPTLGTMGRVDFRLGALSLAQVVIIDDDDPGMFQFAHRVVNVLETVGTANISVLRSSGACGKVSVDYYTTDGSAVSGTHFEHSAGTLTFEPGQTEATIPVPILNNDEVGPDTVFHIILCNAAGNAQIGRQSVAIVEIQDDEGLDEMASNLRTMLLKHREAFSHATSSWKEQLIEAIEPQPGVDDNGEEMDLQFLDYFMHYITIFWKILFCLVPPTAYLGGWLTFVFSLIFVGIVTAVVGELAGLFGCTVGLKDSVTAITFVALGTSLPDLFASRNAAQEADDADAAIGNVTGSNTVNVLLGLGIPWVIGAMYYAFGTDATGGKYCVPSGVLAYSVMVFSCCAVIALIILTLRRKFVGGELGGEPFSKYTSSIALALLWFAYVLLSAFQSYGYIQWGVNYQYDSFGCRISS